MVMGEAGIAPIYLLSWSPMWSTPSKDQENKRVYRLARNHIASTVDSGTCHDKRLLI